MCVNNYDLWHPTKKGCSRAIVTNVARYLSTKLIYSASAVPAWGIVSQTSFGIRLKETCIRLWNPTYQATNDIDVQFTILIMYMDYAIIFGFAVPAMLPLISFVIFMQGAVMHHVVLHLGAKTDRDYRPSFKYLWFSVLMGYLFTSWLFFDGGLDGKWLVLCGIPLCVFVSIIEKWQLVWDFVMGYAGSVFSSLHYCVCVLVGEAAKSDESTLTEMPEMNHPSSRSAADVGQAGSVAGAAQPPAANAIIYV